jgi:hypothetical protein
MNSPYALPHQTVALASAYATPNGGIDSTWQIATERMVCPRGSRAMCDGFGF